MRKLVSCGVAGLAIVVTGYAAARYVGPTQQSTASHASDKSADCAAHARAGCCPLLPACGQPAGLAPCEAAEEDSDAPAPGGVVQLPGQSTEVTPTIFIPDGEDHAPPLPADDGGADDIARLPNQPALMPYCVDSAEPPALMPYADGDPWPAAPADATPVRPVGWFEDSGPSTPEPMPACREDENLSLQYPGCPFPTGDRPTGRDGSSRATPWRHEKEPILPISPDVRSEPVQPAFFDDDTGAVTPVSESAAGTLSNLHQWVLSQPNLKRHTVLKLLMDRGNDNPARQPVDTLEARPSDLHRDEVLKDHF
jgi:hypothetical protein